MLVLFGLSFTGNANPAALGNPEPVLKIGTVAPLYEPAARTLEAAGKWIAQAKVEGCDVVAFPQESILLTVGEPIPGPTSKALAALALENHLYVVANLREKEGDNVYLTSFLLSPEGELLCKYRKTHGYSWERKEFALGNELPVFDTPLGKIAFLVGSDIHFPETGMVYSWLGARLVFWVTEPEPVRDVYRYEQILRIRASDELLTIVASDYAGKSSWYSHSVRGGRVGLPIGRSCVVTPAGEFAADTSYVPGLAVATIRLQSNSAKPLYLYPRSGSYLRQYDLKALVEPASIPRLPLFQKRQARIALHPGQPTDKKLQVFMEKEKPDLLLLPEFGGKGWLEGSAAFAEGNLPALRNLARQNHCYVVVGGIQGETWSMAYIFDRQGEIMGKYAQTTFGLGEGIKVFDTDFCRLGIVVCNDMMFPEISRAEFVLGAELILCPSQFACPSGMHNHRITAARAIDNAAYFALVVPCSQDPWQRVSLIDPYGVYIGQGAFDSPGTPVAFDADFSKGVVFYVPRGKIPMGDSEGKVPSPLLPETRFNLRQEILEARRPELYRCLLNPAGAKAIYAPGKGPAQLPSNVNLALHKSYVCEPRPNYKAANLNTLYGGEYNPMEKTNLTDGVLARGGIADAEWAVWTRDPKRAADPQANLKDWRQASVTVDLGEEKLVGSVAAHLLSGPGYPFPEVSISLNNNGQDFTPADKSTARDQGYLEPGGWPRVDWFVLHPKVPRARYVKFTFSLGENAVQFAVDEIAVFEK